MNAPGRPARNEVAAYYLGYIERCEGNDLFEALEHAANALHNTLEQVPPHAEGHRYAEGKWSIKEVVQHVIDTERIFAYRALRFARNDATVLAAFDENDYAPASLADRRNLSQLLVEHDAVRRASLELFHSFTPDMLLRSGKAGNGVMSVRGLGWAIAGHTLHHAHVIGSRYLTSLPT